MSSRPTGKTAMSGKRVTAKSRKEKERAEKKMRYTPLEYAKKIQERYADEAERAKLKRYKQFLRGKRVYFYGADFNYAGQTTKNKMDIVRHRPSFFPFIVSH